MASYNVKAHVQLSRWLLLLMGCWLLPTVPTSAQVGNASKIQRQDMDRRELQLSNLGRESRQPGDLKRSQAMMDQVSEDFQRILTLHNQIVRAIAANTSLSYQFISDATGEIRKRSAHLQSALKLQRPEPAAQSRVSGPELKVMDTKDELILLCKQIEGFVKNPIIETPGTVDAQQLEKARRDLESVVELSGAIRKRADKQKH